MRYVILCRYLYDPLDRNIGASPVTEAESQRFYCKSRLASKIQGTVTYSIFQHDDQILAQKQTSTEEPATTLLATDQMRSVLHALCLEKAVPFVYSPYGYHSSNSGLLSLLGFNGEEKDPVTGYYFLGNGYRAFNPLLMRFNSPDVLSPFDRGGLNPYTYCLGDPINNVDPTGNSAILRTIKYNLRWLLSKTGIASKNSKEVITSWRATPRDQWVDLLELSHTKKIRYRFDNSKANNQFLSDYNNTIGELGNAQHHSLRPSLKDLDPNAPQDVQFRSVLEHIEHRDYYTGEVIDYDHDRLMLAARYTNDDGVKALPEASTYLKKLNEIRGKKMTKLDERYLYLSKKHINSNRDW